MKKLFNYIPSISITFTLGIIISAINNLISGYTAMSNKGILEIFVMILAIHMVVIASSYINFKTYKQAYICSLLATYTCFLLLSFIFNLFTFTLNHLVTFSLIFLLIFCLVDLYYKRESQIEADKINKKLSKL